MSDFQRAAAAEEARAQQRAAALRARHDDAPSAPPAPRAPPLAAPLAPERPLCVMTLEVAAADTKEELQSALVAILTAVEKGHFHTPLEDLSRVAQDRKRVPGLWDTDVANLFGAICQKMTQREARQQQERRDDDEWENVGAPGGAGGVGGGGGGGGDVPPPPFNPAAGPRNPFADGDGAGGADGGGRCEGKGDDGDAAGAEGAEAYECPVCFDDIAEDDAAMRCAGAGGRAHYFHAHCLSQWAEQCRGQWSDATCPVCRGGVEVHSRRLAQFLDSSESTEGPAAVDAATRGHLQGMLAGVSEAVRGGWGKLTLNITKEQAVEGVGIVAGAGFGFYNGLNGNGMTTGSWAADQMVRRRRH